MQISITSVGQLLAAIPASLGFVPTESVIFTLTRDQVVVMTARIDWQGAANLAPRIAQIARESASDTAYVVAVSSEIEAYDQAGLAAVELDAAGLTVHPVAVAVIGEGVQWQHLITGERGLTEDYRSSAYTAAMAVELGVHVAATRDEVAGAYITTAPVAMAPAQRAAANGAQFAADVAAEVIGVATGELAATDDLAARFGYLITTQIETRDAILWLLHREAHTAAGNLTPLAAPLRGEHRAQVLTVIVALWAIAGRGPIANAVIETVKREELAMPSMLELIDRMMMVGAPPTLLTDALTGSLSDDVAAAALGGYRRP